MQGLSWDEFTQIYAPILFKKELNKINVADQKQFLMEVISSYPKFIPTLIEITDQRPDLQDFIKKMAVLV